MRRAPLFLLPTLLFALRAQALPEDGLTEQQAISRAMLEWDAAARASVLELRMVELGVDPIFGPQASVGTYLPKLSLPTAETAELGVP